MPRSGPRQIYTYTKEFKPAAARLSHTPEMQVKAVVTALGIHPFMLSKWRKDVRDGTLRGRLPSAAAPGPAREVARLQQFEREHALLQEEHELLAKAIRLCAWRKRKSSRSSTPSAPRTATRDSADAYA